MIQLPPGNQTIVMPPVLNLVLCEGIGNFREGEEGGWCLKTPKI